MMSSGKSITQKNARRSPRLTIAKIWWCAVFFFLKKFYPLDTAWGGWWVGVSDNHRMAENTPAASPQRLSLRWLLLNSWKAEGLSATCAASGASMPAMSPRCHRRCCVLFPQGTRITHPSGGFILWVQMPDQVDSLELYKLAKREDITLTLGICSLPAISSAISSVSTLPIGLTRFRKALETLGGMIATLA